MQKTYGKDQHGLRERDLNHKDKQNFDAVLRITSQSVMSLLAQMPDAVGTVAYLRAISCVTDSLLDKSLEATARIEKAWTAVFFVRYWRKWLLLSSDYTLKQNFITSNAYMSIELNAHVLITAVMTLGKLTQGKNYLPWMMGSQNCEKIFWAARSITSTFSTVINFSMLGLLRRLYRLHIQMVLESESKDTGIIYPRTQSHRVKDGKSHLTSSCFVHSVSVNDITDTVNRGKIEAQKWIKSLHMDELLKKDGAWDNPPVPVFVEKKDDEEDNYDDICDEDIDGDDSDDDNKEPEPDVMQHALQEAHCMQDADEIASSIDQLSNAGFIGKEMSDQLNTIHR